MKTVALIAAWLVCTPLWCQQFDVRVDSNRMLIGDLRTAQLTLTGIAEEQVDSLDVTGWLERKVEPVGSSPWHSTEEGLALQMQFMVFDTGYLVLPPLHLTYRTPQGRSQRVSSNDIALEVYGITIDSTGLAPLREIRKESLTLRDVWPYLLALVVLLGLMALYLRRSKDKNTEEVIVEVPLPPDEVALQRLAALDAKKLWQAGKIKEYQSELTHTIRWYLEEKFDVPALESTTGEILSSLSKVGLLAQQRNDLSEILNIADMVKFAKATPSATIHQDFMVKAEQLVRTTRSISTEEE
ncbi:MAG: hypothetical protein KTR24_11220 [Saprospiraceae bacterium]|nr:hypothetical protein [Saprospiraceae bacterium]